MNENVEDDGTVTSQPEPAMEPVPENLVPTVGRMLHYYPGSAEGVPLTGRHEHVPCVVAAVIDDRTVNIAGFDCYGVSFCRTDVQLVQPVDDGAPVEDVGYCEWMPYQVAKAESE